MHLKGDLEQMNDTNINTDTTPLIEVDKLYKSFGKHEVLKGISTTINKVMSLPSLVRQAAVNQHFLFLKSS